MLSSPGCPRAGQSGLWQNWACGSIGDSLGAWIGVQTRRDDWWTRVFQGLDWLVTVPWGATGGTLMGHCFLPSTRLVRGRWGVGLVDRPRPGIPQRGTSGDFLVGEPVSRRARTEP